MKPINGVVIGTVTAVRPGEVKLVFPWLHENDSEKKESDWARIATTMAGNGRGTFFMPEVDDEVLVAFDQGDFNYPYVIGFLWNGKDKPPESNNQVRAIKTKSGHSLEFDDKSGQGKIKIKSSANQEIVINDTPPGNITISTFNPSANININTVTGMVKIDCLNAVLTAKTSVVVNAPETTFAGTVHVPLLKAEAVKSKAYNLGVPGNLLGL
jgi:uncharacterized protein involved in type VI secretion and phage assembly